MGYFDYSREPQSDIAFIDQIATSSSKETFKSIQK